MLVIIINKAIIKESSNYIFQKQASLGNIDLLEKVQHLH